MKLRRTTKLYAVQHCPKFGIPALGTFEYRERERETVRDVHKILVKTHEGIKPCERPTRVDGRTMVKKSLLKYVLFAVRTLVNTAFKLRCIKEWEFPDQPGE